MMVSLPVGSATPAQDDISHRGVLGATGVTQSLDHPVNVHLDAVLAHLPLAFDPRDRDLYADNGAKLLRHVVGWRIVRRPLAAALRLVPRGESRKVRAQKLRIIDEPNSAIDVHRDVIPRRNDLATLELRQI